MKKSEVVIIIIFVLVMSVVGIYLDYKDKELVEDYSYEQYGESKAVSSKNTFEAEKSIVYSYIGDTKSIKITSYDENNNFNIYPDNEDIVSIDKDGNVICLKEGKTYITVEKDVDDYSRVLVVVVDSTKNTIDEVKKQDYEENVTNKKTIGSTSTEDSLRPKDTTQPVLPVYDTGEEEKPTEEPTPVVPTKPEEPTPVVPTKPEEPTPQPTEEPTPQPTEEPTPVVPTQPEEVFVKSIEVNETSAKIYTLDSYKINANVTPNNANNKTLTYKSSDTSILTVDNNGKVLAKKSGTAKVTITSSNNVTKIVNFEVKSRERIHFISHLESTGPKNYDTGDAIVLESNGHYAMIDTGNTTDAIVSNIVKYLKDNNIKTLDFLLITHMHSDHAGNLQVFLENGIHIKNIWMKNYDVATYRENYLPNLNSDNIDKGLGTQVKDGNSNYIANTSLARYSRIVYLAKYSKYKDLVDNIKYVSSDNEGKEYTFKNLKFTMTLYNNTRNVNGQSNENNNSIISLINVNGHKVLLASDAYDTKQFNEIATSVGKIGILKMPHHGSRFCALLTKNYNGKKLDDSGSPVSSTALSALNPKYYIITSSKKKINNIRTDLKVKEGNMCVDKIPSNKMQYYVDESTNALVVDLSESALKFESK